MTIPAISIHKIEIFGELIFDVLKERTSKTPSSQNITNREKLFVITSLKRSDSSKLPMINKDHVTASIGKILEEYNFTKFHTFLNIYLPLSQLMSEPLCILQASYKKDIGVISMAQVTYTFATYLTYLKSIAQSKGVSGKLSAYAQKESKKYLPFKLNQILSSSEKSRVYSYYFAIIKRQVLTSKDSSSYVQRGVLATFVKTLQACGRCADDIIDEMFRNYGSSLDEALLKEFSVKLKAA